MKTTKKTKKLIGAILLTLFAILTLASCSYDGNSNGGFADRGDYAGGYDGFTGSGGLESVILEDRKIIKTVNETVETDAYDSFLDGLNTAIAEQGGYVSSANYSGDSYHNEESLRTAYLTIRIPADKLSAFTERIESLAVVTVYTESIDDVTGAYVDVESRITVLEAEETALLEMLAESPDVTTMLQIRARLNEVQGDLASLRAQKKSYDDRISYSTVTLRIREVRRAERQNQGFFEEVGGNFGDSLYNIGQGFRSFGVWLLGDFLYILIWLAFIFAALVLGRLCYRRLRKNKKTDKPQADEPKNDGEAADSK